MKVTSRHPRGLATAPPATFSVRQLEVEKARDRPEFSSVYSKERASQAQTHSPDLHAPVATVFLREEKVQQNFSESVHLTPYDSFTEAVSKEPNWGPVCSQILIA